MYFFLILLKTKLIHPLIRNNIHLSAPFVFSTRVSRTQYFMRTNRITFNYFFRDGAYILYGAHIKNDTYYFQSRESIFFLFFKWKNSAKQYHINAFSTFARAVAIIFIISEYIYTHTHTDIIFLRYERTFFDILSSTV